MVRVDGMGSGEGSNLGAAAALRRDLDRAARALEDGASATSLRTGLGTWSCVLQGPEPTAALRRAAGLPSSILDRDPPPALVALLHQGGYPARLLTLAPEALDVLSGPPCPIPSRDAMVDELAAATAAAPSGAALGRVRSRVYLQLTRAEVEGAALEEVGSGLSRLAAACIEALLRQAEIQDDVCVLGMGKLGGDELNFFSDIDLVFVHDDAIEADDRRRRLARLHERLRTVVRALEGEGAFRPLFRVDLRLRPFGTQGPLSMSVAATEAYYERHGRDWERQAWLRATPIAGAVGLAEQLGRRLSPFVYRRNVSDRIFGEIGELMQRARRDGGAGPDDVAVDVKLDSGGIREVEFFVQGLQLLHGGKNPSVRTTTTLGALDRLLAAGLLSDREHRDLADAYRLLRRIEHRIQLGEGIQDHRIPADPTRRRLLAARLAQTLRWPDTDPLTRLDDTVRQVRATVRSITATLQPSAPVEVPAREKNTRVVLDFAAPAQRRKEALGALGVADVEEAEALLQHLGSRTDGAFTSHGAARRGAENLLVACLDAADPDVALRHLVEFAALRPAHYGVWRLLAEPTVEGTDLARLTGELFGTSEPLSRGLIGFPIAGGSLRDESIGLLLSAGEVTLPSARGHAAALEDMDLDPRGLEATLIRFKHQQLVCIALLDLGRRPDPLEVGASLADLADLAIRVLVRDLAAEVAAQRPAALGLRIGVFGLGKLGMQAMDYGSDLDLLLVFEAEGSPRASASSSPQSEAIRFGQRLIARLEDHRYGPRLYQVDMRLRPSGRQGLLVSSRASFERYHARALPVWERLALLRLRPVAEVCIGEDLVGPHPAPRPGLDDQADARLDAALPGSVSAAVMPIVRASVGPLDPQAGLDPRQVAAEVRDLKTRIEREIAREGRGRYIHVKAGRGGILELELLIGALQLLHAHRDCAVLERSIVPAIEALHACGALADAESGALRAAYRFQRRLLNRLRMSQAGGIDDPDRFAQNSPRLTTLARRMGLAGPDDLLDQLRQARDAVRAAFDRHLPPTTTPQD